MVDSSCKTAPVTAPTFLFNALFSSKMLLVKGGWVGG